MVFLIPNFKRHFLQCLAKCLLFLCWLSKMANIGPQYVPKTSTSNVPKTSSEDPVWLSQGCKKWRPKMTSRRRPDLTFKVCPYGGWFGTLPSYSQDISWKTFKAHVRDDVGSPVGCLKTYFYFFLELNWLAKSI